jgi:hypothetical protein
MFQKKFIISKNKKANQFLKAQYSIVKNSETIENVENELKEWNLLRKSRFVLSIIGGAAHFTLPTETKLLFKKEIANTAENTGALIITG